MGQGLSQSDRRLCLGRDAAGRCSGDRRTQEGQSPARRNFASALRDALQSGKEVAGTNAVYRYTPTDHYGVDERARVMVVVKDGAFRLAK